MPEVTSQTQEAFAPDVAARQILEIRSFDAALRRRTRGVTWMMWGFVMPGIFLTFWVAALVWKEVWPWWGYFLWLPWGLMGLGATVELWRSAGILAPVEPRRLAIRLVWIGLALLAAIYAGFLATHLILGGGWDRHAPSPAVVVLAATGIACLAWGTVLPPRKEPADRWAFVVAGLFLLVVDAVALLVMRGEDVALQQLVFGWLAPLASAVAFFGAGWAVIARG